MAVGGQAFSQMVEGEKLYDIVLRLPAPAARGPGGDRPPDGRGPRPRTTSRPTGCRSRRWPQIVPHKPGASYIYRENNRRYIPIKFSVRGPGPRLGHRRGPAEGRTTPTTGARLPAGYQLDWSGEFAQMEEANATPALDRAAVDRPDHGAALHGVQLDQGRPPRDGQRRRRDHGGRLGPEADGDAVLDLRGGRVHLDLRRRRPGRGAPDLVLQPDARLGPARSARRSCAGPSCASGRWS